MLLQVELLWYRFPLPLIQTISPLVSAALACCLAGAACFASACGALVSDAFGAEVGVDDGRIEGAALAVGDGVATGVLEGGAVLMVAVESPQPDKNRDNRNIVIKPDKKIFFIGCHTPGCKIFNI